MAVIVRYIWPIATILIGLVTTYAFQIMLGAEVLGIASASVTDPIFLIGSIIAAAIAFQKNSLSLGAVIVAALALFIGIYVAMGVHPSIGVERSFSYHVFVGACRWLGGFTIVSLAWAVKGISFLLASEKVFE